MAEALLVADRKRLNKTSAIALDEISFVKLGQEHPHRLRHDGGRCGDHQRIDILPMRNYTDVAGWID
jgi:transposase